MSIKLLYTLGIRHFLLVPSALLIIAVYFGYIDELNKKLITHYMIPLGFLSLVLHVFFLFLKEGLDIFFEDLSLKLSSLSHMQFFILFFIFCLILYILGFFLYDKILILSENL